HPAGRGPPRALGDRHHDRRQAAPPPPPAGDRPLPPPGRADPLRLERPARRLGGRPLLHRAPPGPALLPGRGRLRDLRAALTPLAPPPASLAPSRGPRPCP